jgi:hypothetical protein
MSSDPTTNDSSRSVAVCVTRSLAVERHCDLEGTKQIVDPLAVRIAAYAGLIIDRRSDIECGVEKGWKEVVRGEERLLGEKA